MDEAWACLKHEGIASLQIIFNIFRQKPIDVLFDKAKAQGVAIIVRLPLASGLLSGKLSRESKFAATDHRNFNRDGQKFNVGETFAGLPFDKGLELVETLREMAPAETPLAQVALKWCLEYDAVTTVIPGAKRPVQAKENAAASSLPSLGAERLAKLRDFYRDQVAEHIRGGY
jgi:aryl-alcohol dehydrogenase-like predicted oxidoreductase